MGFFLRNFICLAAPLVFDWFKSHKFELNLYLDSEVYIKGIDSIALGKGGGMIFRLSLNLRQRQRGGWWPRPGNLDRHHRYSWIDRVYASIQKAHVLNLTLLLLETAICISPFGGNCTFLYYGFKIIWSLEMGKFLWVSISWNMNILWGQFLLVVVI